MIGAPRGEGRRMAMRSLQGRSTAMLCPPEGKGWSQLTGMGLKSRNGQVDCLDRNAGDREMVDLQPLFPRSARAGNDTSAVQSGFRVSFGGSFLAGGAGVFGLAAGTGCCACFAAGGGVAGLVSGFGAGF